ncbi:hypothetical protein BB560_003799 [Smittium megazygosporum]|uniref:RNA-binding S4 domain-containing protein n=1 Tax=Smittium megazygosporum TaxID=133381 RepID=A0A2T9ZAY4_9FUNG|nr:hypothetical protein BB560_003799 [Smittium megazygosporum]
MTISRSNRLSLTRGLVRLSWDKMNLYMLANKSRSTIASSGPTERPRSLFQQQWISKRETRAYHDADLTERQIYKLIPRNLPTVSFDSTVDPAALMYAKLERRVDVIVFRSHFANSIWEARHLILKGYVCLNGSKFKSPSHLVNDGDVISVDPIAICTLQNPSGSSESSKDSEGETPKVIQDPQTPEEKQALSKMINKQPTEDSNATESKVVEEEGSETLEEQDLKESEDNNSEGVVSQKKEKSEEEILEQANKKPIKRNGKLKNIEYEFVPLPFMQPWMFLPDYLEVNYNTCSTVFIREPTITRKGSELPSPFPPESHALAFLYYSKRGRY